MSSAELTGDVLRGRLQEVLSSQAWLWLGEETTEFWGTHVFAKASAHSQCTGQS